MSDENLAPGPAAERSRWRPWLVGVAASLLAFALGFWAPLPNHEPLLTIDNAILVSVLAALIAFVAHLYTRLNRIEAELVQSRDYNNRLWAWARRHLDLYYRWRKSDAPDSEPLPEP